MAERRGNQLTKIEMLHDLSVFSHCPREELERIAAICTEVRVGAGDVVCRQGSLRAEFFVIVVGDAAVDVDGARVATLGRGSFFGEQALLEHSARNATVSATTPLTLLVFNRAEFNTMLSDAPHAASDMLREISHRVNSGAQP